VFNLTDREVYMVKLLIKHWNATPHDQSLFMSDERIDALNCSLDAYLDKLMYQAAERMGES